ncbi:MAG: Zn-ribbon domain-containing OB-fold protein [Alphaproteobacteria bacterium]
MSRDLPAPIVNADSAPYWEGARNGRLLLQRCRDCGTLRFFPRYLCTACGSDHTEWAEASGRGTVHSFTIVHRAAFPEFQARTPYVVALIDLEEGPRMMTNIVGDDALEVAIGDAVTVAFEERGTDGAKVPQFRRGAGDA